MSKPRWKRAGRNHVIEGKRCNIEIEFDPANNSAWAYVFIGGVYHHRYCVYGNIAIIKRHTRRLFNAIEEAKP